MRRGPRRNSSRVKSDRRGAGHSILSRPVRILDWRYMRQVVLVAAFLVSAGMLRSENFLVLPFVNKSPDKSLDWIGDSLAESIREALASQGLVTLDRGDRTEAYQRLSIRP